MKMLWCRLSMSLFVLSAAASLSCSFVESANGGSGRPNRYTLDSSVLIRWDVGLDGLTTKSRVMAFADVDSDKTVDLFVYDEHESQHQVLLYLWNSDKFEFEISSSSIINIGNGDGPVVSIAPADFNYDGRVDVLITVKNSDDNNFTSHVYIQGNNDEGDRVFRAGAADERLHSGDQVLVMDVNGDMKPDLFGVDTEGTRTYWLNDYPAFHKQAQPSSAQTFQNLLLPERANAYADINGDCLADLIVLSKKDNQNFIEIWLASKGEDRLNYEFQSAVAGPSHSGVEMGPLSLIDIDSDGSLDLVYTVVGSDHWFIVTHFNKGSTDASSDSLCGNNANWGFDDLPSEWPLKLDAVYSEGNVQVMNVASKYDLKSEDLKDAIIRCGDLDNDGYPELLMPLLHKTHQKSRVVMLTTFPGEHRRYIASSSKSDSKANKGNDDFREVSTILEKLSSAFVGAFFDLNEDGVSDLMLMDQSNKPVQFWINNMNEDAFFFKTLVENGVCPAWCETEPTFPDPKPYGVSQTGVSVKFTVTDINGDKRVRHGAQLTQSAYSALQTPYVLMGIGRTNNYVEKFNVGVSSRLRDSVGSWSSMIPNSQLVVFPSPIDDPLTWTVELFVSPSQNLLWVAISVICTSAALAVVIIFLHWKELKADEAEQRRAEHFFTF